MGPKEIMTEREVGGDGHSHDHDQDLDLGPDPGQEVKVCLSLEVRGMAIHHRDGKNDGQMTTGEVPEEMIDTKEMTQKNRLLRV